MTAKLRQQARIFVIDDEPTNLKLLEKMLARQGYLQTVPIQDPREVLDRYREARPDLFLLDINMPHLDGYQVMEQLKALNDPLLAARYHLECPAWSRPSAAGARRRRARLRQQAV